MKIRYKIYAAYERLCGWVAKGIISAMERRAEKTGKCGFRTWPTCWPCRMMNECRDAVFFWKQNPLSGE